MFNKRTNFTLIELIVVIAVLGILSAIVIPNIKDMRGKSEIAAVKSNVRNIQTAVDMFYLDYGYYPTDIQPNFLIDEVSGEKQKSQEIINFTKDNFATKYIREEPAKGVDYYIDSYGTVLLDDKIDANKPIIHLLTNLTDVTNKTNIIWEYENKNTSIKIIEEKWVLDGVEGSTAPNGMLEVGSHNIKLLVTYSDTQNEIKSLDKGSEWVEVLDQDFQVSSQPIKIKQVSSGEQYVVALSETGEVYSWGRNDTGQLGLGIGSDSKHNTPQLISFFSDKEIIKIVTGSSHSFAISSNGDIYGWGSNYKGALGLGHENHVYSPQLVTSLRGTGITQLFAGDGFTFGITNLGKVYSWGSNEEYQLGLGNTTSYSTPQVVQEFQGKIIKDISLGDYHGLALTNTGQVYSWGKNDNAQLGLGDRTTRNKIQLISSLSNKNILDVVSLGVTSFALNASGEVYSFGKNNWFETGLESAPLYVLNPTLAPKLNDTKQMMKGVSHCFSLKTDNEWYGWGNNGSGQLGDGTNIDSSPKINEILADKNIKYIASGWQHSVGLSEDGKLYSWGMNSSGQLGIGSATSKYNTPQPINFFNN